MSMVNLAVAVTIATLLLAAIFIVDVVLFSGPADAGGPSLQAYIVEIDGGRKVTCVRVVGLGGVDCDWPRSRP